MPRLALLLAAAAVLSAIALLRGVNVHDEGLMLQAAARIAEGQLPWRDSGGTTARDSPSRSPVCRSCSASRW